MKAYRRSRGIAPLILNLGKNGELHAPVALLLGKRPLTHWTGGRVANKTGLDVLENRKFCYLQRNSKAEPSSP